jgi:hypothetical protein
MASSSVIHPAQQQKSAVVPISRQFPQAITQTELVLYLSLVGRLQQLQEQVETAQEEFKTRLEAGAVVQPGDHIARLDERARRNVAWRAISEDLADTVFGEGKGASYCDEVLGATQPTLTIALVVR